MAKARAIVKRRKAVRNIRKITQTMQLIATARFQKCMQRASATKPYTEQISAMVETVVGTDAVQRLLATLSSDADGGDQTVADAKLRVLRVLQPNEGVKPSIMLVISSNRGLCGSYNAGVLRTARQKKRELEEAGFTPSLEMVGKKGIGYFRFLGVDIQRTITDVEDRIEYSRVAAMAERFIEHYVSGEIARVDVAYVRFHSIGVQRPEVVQLLPIEPPQSDASEEKAVGGPDFEFSPPPDQLLTRLIPETIKVRLLQCFNDAIVSEQVCRMVAMKSATDAADDMIKFLTGKYNRARQSQITLELADIVGGAEAVK